jgi:hypothetical protein
MKKEDLLERLFHLKNGIVNYLYIMKKTVKKMVKRYAAGGASSDTRPVQNAPKVTITPKKPVSKAEAPKAKPAPKPAPKPAAKKPAAKPSYSAVKDIKSRMYPNTGTPKPGVGVKATTKPKPTTKTPAKPAAKTVSQVWADKTGMSWSEAKKLGLTDGSAKSNLALLDKLNKGSVSKSSISDMKKPAKEEKMPTLSVKGTTVTKSNTSPSASSSTSETTPKPTAKQMSGSGMGAMERMEGIYKKGGSVKKKMKSKKG